mmetsp:Transcript_20731/g.69533  ORF Transcript_20731/g.69533 Transcript_20731/m.69533 type:complete len:355 (-) Transcript_20731:196-1260(-)
MHVRLRRDYLHPPRVPRAVPVAVRRVGLPARRAREPGDLPLALLRHGLAHAAPPGAAPRLVPVAVQVARRAEPAPKGGVHREELPTAEHAHVIRWRVAYGDAARVEVGEHGAHLGAVLVEAPVLHEAGHRRVAGDEARERRLGAVRPEAGVQVAEHLAAPAKAAGSGHGRRDAAVDEHRVRHDGGDRTALQPVPEWRARCHAVQVGRLPLRELRPHGRSLVCWDVLERRAGGLLWAEVHAAELGAVVHLRERPEEGLLRRGHVAALRKPRGVLLWVRGAERELEVHASATPRAVHEQVQLVVAQDGVHAVREALREVPHEFEGLPGLRALVHVVSHEDELRGGIAPRPVDRRAA